MGNFHLGFFKTKHAAFKVSNIDEATYRGLLEAVLCIGSLDCDFVLHENDLYIHTDMDPEEFRAPLERRFDVQEPPRPQLEPQTKPKPKPKPRPSPRPDGPFKGEWDKWIMELADGKAGAELLA